MKNLLLLFAVFISLTSCSNQSVEQLIEQKATEHIKKNMNDPDSFEFVEIVSIDTLLMHSLYSEMSTGIERELDNMASTIEKSRSQLSSTKSQIGSDTSSLANELRVAIKSAEELITRQEENIKGLEYTTPHS